MRDFGGFEIRGLLGAGGMGEVHRAYDKRLGREVAIKLLPPNFASDADSVARFEREARVLASLNHPIGYVSKQSGRDEVYVRSSTGEGGIWTISSGGGVEPVWSADGRELFYRADDKMMAVDVELSTAISFGKPRVLFEGSYLFGPTESQGFDVSRDGRRFLMLKPERRFEAMPLTVIVNWFDDLRRRAPPSP